MSNHLGTVTIGGTTYSIDVDPAAEDYLGPNVSPGAVMGGPGGSTANTHLTATPVP